VMQNQWCAPRPVVRANLLQELKHAYTGKDKRSVEAHSLRLPSRPGVACPVICRIDKGRAEAFRAPSSKGLMESCPPWRNAFARGRGTLSFGANRTPSRNVACKSSRLDNSASFQ